MQAEVTMLQPAFFLYYQKKSLLFCKFICRYEKKFISLQRHINMNTHDNCQ